MRFPKGTTDHPFSKSGKREILVSVWDFGATHPQTERSYYSCNDHPAKMHPSVARAILQLYGESPVLDPMAGIGTTLVEAILLEMDAVGVEYEKRFVNQANKNIEHVRKLFPTGKLGKAVCVQGDARKLSLALKKKKVKSILFSPPYWKAMKCRASSRQKAIEKYQSSVKRARKVGGRPISKALAISNMGYSSSKENIGNITKFGSIVLSPPYEAALNASKHVGGIASRDPQLAKTGLYSKSKDNIGNTVGRTYLGEMLKVYRECYRVLKPDKFMVVVVKDIQRNWKTVPLGADTIKLCQMAGFDCHDIIINKMYFPSFWMLNLAKKAQTEGIREKRKFHVLKSHEYILVFRKPM